MNLLQLVLDAQQGGAVGQLASRFNLDQGQAVSAISALVPALAAGLSRNVAQQGGLESLLGALGRGDHARYLDAPTRLGEASTLADGNAILGHVLGSKDVSRRLAGHAASQTGLSQDLLKQMLPVVATMVMGALSQRTRAAGVVGGQASPAPASALGVIAPLLDVDGDGSVVDDVLGMVGRLFGGR
jgi:hypothetical protein